MSACFRFAHADAVQFCGNIRSIQYLFISLNNKNLWIICWCYQTEFEIQFKPIKGYQTFFYCINWSFNPLGFLEREKNHGSGSAPKKIVERSQYNWYGSTPLVSTRIAHNIIIFYDNLYTAYITLIEHFVLNYYIIKKINICWIQGI